MEWRKNMNNLASMAKEERATHNTLCSKVFNIVVKDISDEITEKVDLNIRELVKDEVNYVVHRQVGMNVGFRIKYEDM